MIDFPIDELMDEDVCHPYLLNRLHPDGLKCPRCGGEGRHTVKRNTWSDGYNCTGCKQYYTMCTGTAVPPAAVDPIRNDPGAIGTMFVGLLLPDM